MAEQEDGRFSVLPTPAYTHVVPRALRRQHFRPATRRGASVACQELGKVVEEAFVGRGRLHLDEPLEVFEHVVTVLFEIFEGAIQPTLPPLLVDHDRLTPERVPGRVTTVYEERVAGYERGALRGQKNDRVSDLMRLCRASHRYLVQLAQVFPSPLIRAQQTLHPWGIDEPRSDRVHADVVLGPLDGEHLGQHDQAGFGGGVVSDARAGHGPGGRGDVDDIPRPPLPYHPVGRSARAQERRSQVDPEDVVPLFDGQIQGGGRRKDTGTVDENVERPERADGTFPDLLLSPIY